MFTIHTDTLVRRDLHDALASAGLDDVRLYITSERGSRSHARAFEVTLRGHGVRHKRYTNTGNVGASSDRAATYNDWGWWLAVLFDAEPTMKAGGYRDLEHFHQATSDKFRTARPVTA